MNNNKRLFILGGCFILLLILLISLLFINLSSNNKSEKFVIHPDSLSVFSGVPSDAVAIVDLKEYENVKYLLNDTTSFAYKFFDKDNGMVDIQESIFQCVDTENAPVVYSMHYSTKNSVALLQVINVKDGEINKAKQLLCKDTKKRKYNGIEIYTTPNSVYLAFYKHLLLVSTSTYIIESSIRHLENGVSILNNENFLELLTYNGDVNGVYINNGQIGKFFSGAISRDYLKYSDFFLKFASWSYLKIGVFKNRVNLNGYFLDNSEKIYNSSVYSNLENKKSLMGEILPATTVFAVSFPIYDIRSSLEQQRIFWETQKKLSFFKQKQNIVKGNNSLSPEDWIDSLNVEEVVSAYCKFGDKCEWITLIREKQKFGIGGVVSSVIDKKETNPARAYEYKGYMSSIFGNIFSNCNEEFICKIGQWNIIGSKQFINEYVSGSAYFFNLEDYISQTPMDNSLSGEAVVKIVANLKEAGDSLLNIFKLYGKKCFASQLERNNFEFLTLDIISNNKVTELDIDFYAAILEKVPKPKHKDSGEKEVFIVDSTIVIPSGPYEVRDVTKKDVAYLEQLPNLRLRYLDASKKGIWAVPFESPLCGFVEQIDLYDNGRLQMLFISGDKMYLLDRLGRFVNKYPKKLLKEVVLGPKLVRGLKGENYSVMVLNKDNTYSWYGIGGNRVAGWKDIKVPEFVRELPEIEKIGGKWYWIVRAPSRLYLYNLNGELLKVDDNKKVISRDSKIISVGGKEFKVKCTDGKDYLWNVESGKLKKCS